MNSIALPKPSLAGEISLEHTLQNRRSIRRFSKRSLTLAEISQLLWATQGVTHPAGYRTAPSAGALYPLDIFLVAGRVESLAAGVFHYRPAHHDLIPLTGGDLRTPLVRAALGQGAVSSAPAVVVLTGAMARTTGKYGDRGIRYVFMEAGHAAQNLALQAVGLELGTVMIGAFHDGQVGRVLGLPPDYVPLYLIPTGKPAGQ